VLEISRGGEAGNDTTIQSYFMAGDDGGGSGETGMRVNELMSVVDALDDAGNHLRDAYTSLTDAPGSVLNDLAERANALAIEVQSMSKEIEKDVNRILGDD
jgi:hypothetical protein